MKKKILFILHLPPPIHGAAVMGLSIYESSLINETFDCKYINLSASENVNEIGKVSFSKITHLLKSISDIVSTIIKYKPDLCYITPSSWDWGFYRDLIVISILKLMRVKVVAHFHNKGVEKWNNKWFNICLQHFFYKKIKVILLSKELISEKERYVKKEDLFLCPNGIKESGKSRLSIKNDKFTFLFLSNMMEEKGVIILLKSCKILKDRGYDFRCNFVGKWADITEDNFNCFIYQNNLSEHVFAYGPKYGAEKDTFYENADAFVFPTFYHGETFGLVILEAMDFGLPCISTYEGGIPSVIEDGKTGYLVNQKDVSDLTEKMIYFISNPEKCIEMGRVAKERFDNNFTLKHFENNIITILKKCL